MKFVRSRFPCTFFMEMADNLVKSFLVSDNNVLRSKNNQDWLKIVKIQPSGIHLNVFYSR